MEAEGQLERLGRLIKRGGRRWRTQWRGKLQKQERMRERQKVRQKERRRRYEKQQNGMEREREAFTSDPRLEGNV